MDYAEQLLTGLDYVIQARLKEHKFDETIICTIVDNAKANEGLYVVSDGTIKFDAYSESIDYKVDQAVRVNIPKGDYSQKKYIVGRAVSEKNGNQPIVYNAPSAQILDISNNVFPSGAGRNWSIFANADGNKPTEKLIKSINLHDEYEGLIYDTLYLKASFKTIFNQYAICAGGYGLYIKATMSSKDESGKQNQRIYYLDSKHMFGNPYNYLISSSQETNFFIGKDESITNIEIYLYQDGGFKYKDDAGNIKTYSKSKFAEDIIVSDIYIGLGVDLIQVEDNKVEIQTAESLNYNDPTTDVDNTKIIRLQWYNKDENNQYIGFSDGVVPESTEENELDYAKRLSEHNRIVAQMKKDGVPDDYAGFELNARSEEIQTIWKTLRTLIDKDLYSEIKKFRNALNGKAKDEFANWIADIKDGINSDTGYSVEIKNQFESLLDFYKNGLSFAEKAQTGSVVYKEEEKEDEIYKYYFENDTGEILIKPSGLRSIENQLLGKITDNDWLAYNNQGENVEIPAGSLNELEKCINDSLASIETAIAADTNLRSIYDSYKIKIEKIRDKIIAERDTFKALICGNLYRIEIDLDNSQGEDTTADYYTSWYLFEDPLNKEDGQGLLTNRLIDKDGKVSLKKKPYDPSKFDTKSNQYSIYWYYYRDGYKATDGENYLGGDNWCTIEDPNTINGKPRFEVFNENDNIGLPAPVENKETGELEYPAKPKIDDENGYLTISFSKERPDIKEEKIKAIVIYNHEKYESNILTFENKDPAAGPELTNDIQIIHGSNSKDVYSLYGVDNTLISASEFNTKRQLKVQYLNERGEPESGDETVLKGASIYWYVPTYATMLRTYNADLIASSEQSENFTKGSAVDWDFQVVTEMAGEDDEREYVVSCELIYKTERPTFKDDNSDDTLFVYKGTTYSTSEQNISDGGTITEDDDDNSSKVIITYTYEYNNDCKQFQLKINDNITIPLSYGGITYSISNDGKYILSSDGTKYRIQNNTVTLPIDMVDQDDRKGYEYYYKRIEDVSDLTFTYRIKDYYSASFTNNTIKCKIIKGNQQLEGSINIDFNSYGSNGTSYSLIIKPLPLTTADINWDKVTNAESGEEVSWIYNNRTFEIMLFDYENKQIPFNSAPTVKIIEGNASTNVTIEPNASNEAGVLSYITNKIKVSHYDYRPWILEVTSKQPWPLNSNNFVELKSFYPIPLSGIGTEANPGPYQGNFPTTIVYDSLGGTPSYYKDPLTLYDKNGNLVENCVWSIQYYDDSGQLDTTDEDDRKKIKFSPQLQGDANGMAKLIPNIMYISNNTICTVLKCATEDAGFRWLQPLVICQNRYPSAMLNNWDGGLFIDEDNNRILANIIGAGKKESDNSFSGVLMGEVKNTDVPTDTTRNDLQHPHTGTGLYGFHHGEQSFGFNVNGTAFIGKSGSGRVAFDGNHGFIYSQNWLTGKHILKNGLETKQPFFKDTATGAITLNQGTAGMAIDLQNGHIDAYNFKLTSAGIQLNSNPDKDKKENYFLIGNKDESDNTYLEYSANGDLIMRVNEFQLTSVMGGPNLLHNTAPKETPTLTTDGDNGQASDPIQLDHWWSGETLKVGERDNKRWILLGGVSEYIDNDQIKYRRQLFQKLDGTIGNLDSYNIYFTKGKYILSGLLYSKIGKRQLTFRLGHWDNPNSQVQILPIGDAGYYEIKLIFNITADDVKQIFQIIDTSNDKVETSTWFHHLKLEKGTIATDWSQSELDIKNYADAMDNVSQETVFNRLTNNGATQGIILQDGKLYINATYINSGALTVKKGSATLFSADIEKQEVNVAGWIANNGTAPLPDTEVSKRKFLFIGDSYGAGVNAYTEEGELLGYGWPYYLAARIWKQDSVYNNSGVVQEDYSTRYVGAAADLKTWMAVCQGGAGFANASQFDNTDTYSFSTLVQNAAVILKNKFNLTTPISLGEITDIVVGGGWNDMWYDRREPEKNEIKSGITEFVKAAKRVCSKLERIMVFGIGTCSNSYFAENDSDTTEDDVDKQQAEKVLNEMYQKYSNAISDLNNNPDYNNIDIQFIDIHSFSSNDTVFSTDHVHPVEEGLGMIANAMDYYIRGGNNSRLYNNCGGYNSDLQGFYLSNIPSDYWAIQIGPKNADFSAVGGTKDTLHRPFLVSQSGVLWAQGAHITGNIVATSGDIGGWIITSTGISKSTVISESPKEYYWTTIQPPKGQVLSGQTFLGVQHYNNGTSEWPFYVRHDGTLHAEKIDVAHINAGSIGGITIKESSGGLSGTGWSLTSTSGTIGGWKISSNGLESDGGSTYLKPNGTCYFMPNGPGNGGVGVVTNTLSQIQLALTDKCWLTIGKYYLDEQRLGTILRHAGIISNT